MNNLKSPLTQIDKSYDVVIVGGGIVGAGIFRDLALHNIKCLIIDKKDFSSQTSQRSSKMLHGGIRYMETLNFGLVHESLHEKELWLEIAPHLCYEESFHMPVYKETKFPLWALAIGLTFYNLLAGFRRGFHNIFPDIMGKKTALTKIPFLSSKGLKGVAVYHDAVVDDSKITLENIYDGLLKHDCSALNYCELKNLKKQNGHYELELRDTLTNETASLEAQDIIFATGPFTDKLFDDLQVIPWTPKILPSKGSHIYIKKESLPLNHPLVLQTKDNRIIFVIPQKDSVLVGTTEELTTEDFFDIKPSPTEITYLLEHLKKYFPKANITQNEILSSYAGIRPLVKKGKSNNLGKTARNHKIYSPLPNVHIIVGGKLTTFRSMGQKISKKIVKKHHFNYSNKTTATPLKKKSIVSPFKILNSLDTKTIFKIIEEEKVRTLEDLVIRRLSIPSRNHWPLETKFNDFFLAILPELQNRINISKDDILNFP